MAKRYETVGGELVTFQVRIHDKRTCLHGRANAMATVREHGFCVWLRADGERVTVLYKDGGRIRSRTRRYAKIEAVDLNGLHVTTLA